MSNFPVDIFFSDPTLTVQAAYNNGTTITNLTVHFFSPYEEMALFGIQVQNAKPSIIVRDVDIPGIVHKSHTFTINGILYNVDSTQPDGTGITRIFLTQD